ncbi:MAG: nitrile hydratase accessory protein [Acidimicrobiia bacterium]|nr:nitrile hydratase accessory protein [Acidimicrobiia bacterium]
MSGHRTEVGDARRRVETLVARLPGGDGERSFDHPWELRAFAMAVAAYDNGYYDWSEFQLSLIESIRQWETDQHGDNSPDLDAAWSYYDHWLTALETVLADGGALEPEDLDDRTRQILTTPRDANHHTARRDPVAIDPAR